MFLSLRNKGPPPFPNEESEVSPDRYLAQYSIHGGQGEACFVGVGVTLFYESVRQSPGTPTHQHTSTCALGVECCVVRGCEVSCVSCMSVAAFDVHIDDLHSSSISGPALRAVSNVRWRS